MPKVPSLVDLCVQLAIDNVRYLGDVGETDSHLLDRILTHCTLEQLTHIENSTEAQFGDESTNIVIARMKQNRVTFKWRQLYEAKIKEREEATQRSLDRIKQRYQEEDARKKSRQVQLCTKVPSASKKRSWGSSYGGVVANNIYNTKSGLMKKAKLDFVNSREVKNLAAMNNKVVHRNHSVSSVRKPVAASRLASSSSSSKMIKPPQKRF